jgi:hypothetical protein
MIPTTLSHGIRLRAATLVLGLGIAIATACSGNGTSTQPAQGTPGNQLHFLTQNSSAPQLAGRTVSFYAVDGQTRSGSIYYHHDDDDDEPGDSTALATLTVPAGALTTDSTGAPLSPGDSVLVTLTVTDSEKLLVQVGPSGLTFSASTPAVLQMAYQKADSSIAAADTSKLAIWREPTSGGNWFKLPSTVNPSALWVRAGIPGHSVYATAY